MALPLKLLAPTGPESVAVSWTGSPSGAGLALSTGSPLESLTTVVIVGEALATLNGSQSPVAES